MEIPKGLLYTSEHEWVKVKGDIAVVGITDYAQSELGDIVFVELPEVGTDLELGGEFGVVESVKTVSNLYVPLTGTVKKVNKKLADKPDLVNSDCYEEGWMLEIQIADKNEVDDLLSPEEYQESLDEESD